ncbi:MAG: hypothetical protein A2430_02985 [Candidatus Liptonbacteria bacterium RIFOXYC1_FULL_36_8]|uniref:Uncharacterized protein n=3 Tax=Candidatus Liptoniibacteriota TaxID=1817909 RepID=A0A1G2CNL5_9BACT|nr:MAG: hypothetical protein A2390_00095 [Candidatus Liptonbacteria bacterium RIFOXYB1_FULL_36_10]OGZ03179.1 MAG: hypothetical protein A2604_02625 [Candidatus Liptonbacteria bacterium RIFOXYD1_FULL_36_11]OGZ03361.1 MAG: hypothetical protein A2430_02985 [Candidatus Liptonbacteria bacterium RIFOXYC1_FULL_36_8]
MNKKEIFITLGASLMVISAFILPQVFASGQNSGNGQAVPSADFIAVEKAIESKNYSAWQSLVSGQKVAEVINEQNFSQYANALLKIKEGEATLKELGVGRGFGFKGEMKKKPENQANFTAIKNAIENNDYNTWKSLMDNNKITETITAENFSKFTEAHKLLSEGKADEAKAIFEELGLKRGIGMGFGGGRLHKAAPAASQN